jgi:UDP-2-acetamido-2,6-beta-L-arabino-hexul-4-ose reductase
MFENILITGAKGFIGKNLSAELSNKKKFRVLEFDIDDDIENLGRLTAEADLIFHLAGINRPLKTEEFREGNVEFTIKLLDLLRKSGKSIPLIFTSSTQAVLDNPYGRTKLEAENYLAKFAKETGSPVIIYRLTNVFGKWCRPSYNSVVATFCHNIAHDLPVQINDNTSVLNLIYIDDLIREFLSWTEYPGAVNGFSLISNFKPIYTLQLGQLAELIGSFKNSRTTLEIPDMSDDFIRKLYATYLSYLPEDQYSYKLKMNTDNRGSFTEFIRTSSSGQVSVNISRPGIVKGNHWHHTKNEKFLVVSGTGVIRFRKIGTENVTEYKVSGHKLEVIDVPPGQTHNIENLGDIDMVTVMWASETFNPDKPDTFFEEV